jgi:hypothetical protein
VPEFQGKVRLTANPFDLVGAGVEVGADTLTLIVSGQEVGEWPLGEVAIKAEIDGFHMSVDGEDFVFMTREADAFAAAVGVSRFGTRNQKSGRSARAVKALKAPAQMAAQAAATPATGRKAPGKATSARPPKPARPPWSDRIKPLVTRLRGAGVRVGVPVAIVILLLAIFARPVLAGILLFTGLAGILVIGAVSMDPLLATRLPEGWTARRLVPVALAVIAAGLLLVAF